MDATTSAGLFYDCLYYKKRDDQLGYTTKEQNFKNQYHIIPYCIRPFSATDKVYNEVVYENLLSQFTFEELRRKKVSTNDLLSWSASIDLVEHYDEYLTLPSNVSLRLEMFYNCSSPWFGIFCQYKFIANLPFNIIVNQIFSNKSSYYITNITCYIDLKCNRGPAPACLDWREICDRKIDCIGNGTDEAHCFELEVNECKEDEFRCHNGLCIPEEFLNEGPQYPDCLDGTDDNMYTNLHDLGDVSSFNCFKDSGFWCEETDFIKRSRFFVCGDGDGTDVSILYPTKFWNHLTCRSMRDTMMKESLLSFVEHSDLSYECWLFLKCNAIHYHILECGETCDDSDESNCYVNLKSKCPIDFVIFPQRPILQSHVSFVYLTNKTILINEKTSIFPDFVCHDVKRCPFLPTASTLDINGTTCRSTEEFGLYTTIDIINFFQACLTEIENEIEIDHIQSPLFLCPGTTKYISKHRVLDGVVDCYNGTDEINVDACQWNHKYRFQCSSENKCISHILVRNGIKDCLEGEDELPILNEQISFQKFCNGYQHWSPRLIDGLNETDETHCDDWPCNNLYTRCDGAWNCPNGADELNCIPSKCPLDTHECISPETRKIICLPVHLAGNGIVDCLGSTDERKHCRLLKPINTVDHYKCWNETFCTHSTGVCSDDICLYEETTGCSDDMKLVFNRLDDDRKLQNLEYKYFLLESSATKIFLSNSTTSMSTSQAFSNQSDVLFRSITNEKIIITPSATAQRRALACHRGIQIYFKSSLTTDCLCPPSYYGDRCQYQSQRVSLILQFSRICPLECVAVFGIIITLIDQNNIVHAHEQLTYTTTYECENKFSIYLLYQLRSKDMTKTYNVQIDAYNKTDLSYYASWILPVRFLFLPVNKISAHLIIPAYPVSFSSNCLMFCGHGQCFTYVNNPNQTFCRCESGWSGINCTISHNCDCSPDSKCLNHINNQSICFCSLRKYGPRCRLQSICQNDICKNNGQCIPYDQRILRNTSICLCPVGFSGSTCEISQSTVNISFNDLEIPRSLLVHFITVQIKADPMRTTISTKIPYDQDIAIVHISIPFHIIIVQILNQYFLAYVKANYTSLSVFSIQLNSKQQCPHVQQLFDNKTFATYPLVRRVKYYHLFCKKQSQLKCFHDNEDYMCLCNEEQYANCFPFDFNTKYTCQGLGECRNGAECFSDRPQCPYSIFCACADCFYGSKCLLTTKGFGLSLDAILGYQIRPRLSVNRQPTIVKVSIVLTTIMLIVGLINSTLSIITFKRKMAAESGCRQYLLVTSIFSLCSTILFSMKFLMLLLSQMSLITNIIILRISCISIDVLLRLAPIIVDWLHASVAIDRALTVITSTKFSKKKSKQAVQWVTMGILLITISSILHDPIHRQVIYDKEEERRWCLVQYSSSLEIYNSAINIIHFFIPFMINILTAIIIIFVAARKRSTARQQQTYRQHLSEQFHQHKHLIISSIILVILATPRLIISFTSGCMKSARNPSLYLAGYFISFIPPSLTFIVFVITSKSYTKEFYEALKRIRTMIQRKLTFV